MQLTKEQQERRDQEASLWIRHNFGKRYEKACLSKCLGNDGNLQKAVKWLTNPLNFLVYLGSPGISKTYFLAACARHFFISRNAGIANRGQKNEWILPPDIQKFTEKSFFSKLKSKFDDTGDVAGYGKYIADCDIFMLDELGKGMGTDWQCEQLFDLIDERYSLTRPTLIVSNFNRKEIESHYGERYGKFMISRLFATENCVLEDWESTDLRGEGL